MLSLVRRLLEPRREETPPVTVLQIDLQKTYDSVDRDLLREALARIGVPLDPAKTLVATWYLPVPRRQ